MLSLERPQGFLRPGLSVAALQRVAASLSDTKAERRTETALKIKFLMRAKSFIFM
jgi:hypothetical protein